MSRSLALPSQDITLTVIFYDSSGAPKDPDVLNNVLLDVYPPGSDPRDPATVTAPIAEIATFLHPAVGLLAASEYVVITDQAGGVWGVQLDTTGADLAPTGAIWAAIPPAQTAVTASLAAMAAPAVATAVRAAFVGIVGFNAVVTLTDNLAGTLTSTQAVGGVVIDPRSLLEDDSGAGAVNVTVTTPGSNGDGWVYDVSLVSFGIGPEADPLKFLTHPSTGHFEYIFTVPAGASLGDAYDYWTGVVDGQNLAATLSFNIGSGGEITSTEPPLYENNAVYFKLLSTVADNDDGTQLGVDYTWYFTTKYNPLYESFRRIQLDMGSLVSNLPIDTINLAIFEASIEADALTFGTVTNNRYFTFARRQYVACTAEMILLHALLGASGEGGGGKSKTLADLKVSTTGGASSEGGLLERVLNCRVKWEAMLTSAGEIGPGTSQKPSMVVKGTLDPDRPPIGRTWEPVSSWGGSDGMLPAANTRIRWTGNRRYRRGFVTKNRWDTRFS